MTELPILAKLFRASQQAYDVTVDGPVPVRPPFDQINWLRPPAGFAVGVEKIDAALVGETASEVIVAFRGTLPFTSGSPDKQQVVRDWLNDIDALLVTGLDLPGLVHQGFLEALDGLWPSVLAAIPDGKPIYVTGHSKGGALANLAAARLARQPGRAPIVTTFAAAKPGDAVFHQQYDILVPHSVRYEYGADLVPHLPLGFEFRAAFRLFPLFADAITLAASRLPEGVAGYEGVGELLYIEDSGEVVPDGLTLRIERYFELSQLALNPAALVSNHSLGDKGGYAKAALPPASARDVEQAVPGVAPIV